MQGSAKGQAPEEGLMPGGGEDSAATLCPGCCRTSPALGLGPPSSGCQSWQRRCQRQICLGWQGRRMWPGLSLNPDSPGSQVDFFPCSHSK